MGTDKTGIFGPGSVSRPPRSDARSATLHDLVDANRTIGRTLKHAVDRDDDLRALGARLDYVSGQVAWLTQAEKARWSILNQAFTQVASLLVAVESDITATKARQLSFQHMLGEQVRELDHAKLELETAFDAPPPAAKQAKDAKDGKDGKDGKIPNRDPLVAAVKRHFVFLHRNVDLGDKVARDTGHGLDAAAALVNAAVQSCLDIKKAFEAIDANFAAPPAPPPPEPPPSRSPAPPDPVRSRARDALEQLNEGGFAVTGRREEIIEEREAEAGLLRRELADEDTEPDLKAVNLRKPWRRREPGLQRGTGLESELIGDGVATDFDDADEGTSAMNIGPRS